MAQLTFDGSDIGSRRSLAPIDYGDGFLCRELVASQTVDARRPK